MGKDRDYDVRLHRQPMIRTSLKPVVALPCLLVIAMQTSCLLHSKVVKISGPVTIDDQWTELRPSPPLKTEKDLQLLLLDLDPPFKDDLYTEGRGPDSGKGVLMPDGETINPVIELIDQYDKSFSLGYAGARGVV